MNQLNNLNTLDKIEKNKRYSLIGFIITFSCWQLGQIVSFNFSDSIGHSTLIIFQLLTFGGSIGWIGFSYYVYRSIGFLKQHPELKPQLDDERATIIRLRAMSYGFVITVGSSALFFGISFVIDSTTNDFYFGGTFMAQTIMLIGIVSSVISYLILDSQE